MKYLPLLLTLLFVQCSVTKIPENKLIRTEIIEAKGSQDELYVKANNWFVETFVNAESVIQFTDKESGNISGKYISETKYYSFKSVIMVELKDNRVRITSKNPTAKTNGVKSATYRPIDSYTKLEEMNQSWDLIFASFEQYMNSQTDEF